MLHDLNLAARYCEQLVLLDNGKVARAGRTEDLLTPAVLEPVYEVAVRRLSELGAVQLIFGPLDGIPSRATAIDLQERSAGVMGVG
ncbi:MAG: hypothetical protein ACRDST_14860 [Pseudonocardiaceae bacterium]